MFNRELFIQRVQHAVASHGWTMARASAHAFCCETRLSTMLNHIGKHGPTAASLCAIADELGVSTDYLLGRTDE